MISENLYPNLNSDEQLTSLEWQLNLEIYQFLQEEYEKNGDKLLDWYRRFLPNKVGLAHHDIAMARFYMENCQEFERYVEIGAGAAQQSILLAARGIKTTPVESDIKLFDLMTRLIDRIADRVDAQLPNYIEPICDRFPNKALEYVDDRAILSFPGTASTGADEHWEKILAAASIAGGIFVNKCHFFWYRGSEDERQKLIDEILERGFEAPVNVSEWRFRYFVPNAIVYMKRASRMATAG